MEALKINEAVKEIRLNRNISVENMVEYLGMPKKLYEKFENGNFKVAPEYLYKMLEGLEYSKSDFKELLIDGGTIKGLDEDGLNRVKERFDNPLKAMDNSDLTYLEKIKKTGYVPCMVRMTDGNISVDIFKNYADLFDENTYDLDETYIKDKELFDTINQKCKLDLLINGIVVDFNQSQDKVKELLETTSNGRSYNIALRNDTKNGTYTSVKEYITEVPKKQLVKEDSLEER